MSTCRHCGQVISFRLTRGGAHQPVNADGSIHFASCKVTLERKAERERRKERQARKQPALIDTRGCPFGCEQGWITEERDGVRGVRPCPKHRK